MKYKVLSGFCIGKGVDAQVGEEIELPERDAIRWVSQRRLRRLVVDEDVSKKENHKGGKNGYKSY